MCIRDRYRAPEHSSRGDVTGHPTRRSGAGEDLETPVQHIRYINGLVSPNGHEVSPSHLAGFMPRFTKRSQDPAVLVQFDNAIISAICHPNVLIGCDHQTIRVADAGPLVNEVAILVEDLYALILTVADIDATLLVDGNRVGQIEFSWACAVLAPGLDVIAVPIELDDARIPITVGSVDVAVFSKGHIGRLVEKAVCLSAGIDPTQYQQNGTRGVQFEYEIVSIVRCPQVIVGIDSQPMGMHEESLANALDEIALVVILRQHWLRPVSYTHLRAH